MSLYSKLRILGQQGMVEYAERWPGVLYYRFLDDPPEKDYSWKPVAT